jgi:hypothetical protein
MPDRTTEIAAFLAETADQDDDAVWGGIISRWPDATGWEIEDALAAFATLMQLGASASNENALAATD